MNTGHLQTLLGLMLGAVVGVWATRSRTRGVRILLMPYWLLGGAAIGALADAEKQGAFAVFQTAEFRAYLRELRQVDWGEVLRSFEGLDLGWGTWVFGFVALVVLFNALGIGFLVRAGFRRFVVSVGLALAAAVSIVVLMVVKAPQVTAGQGWVYAALTLFGMIVVHRLLFGVRGLYWSMPGAEPEMEKGFFKLFSPEHPIRGRSPFQAMLTFAVMRAEGVHADRARELLAGIAERQQKLPAGDIFQHPGAFRDLDAERDAARAIGGVDPVIEALRKDTENDWTRMMARGPVVVFGLFVLLAVSIGLFIFLYSL